MRLFLEFGIEFMDAMHEIEWNWRKLMKLRVLTRLHDFETVVFWGISWEGELCGLDDAVKADLGNAKQTGHNESASDAHVGCLSCLQSRPGKKPLTLAKEMSYRSYHSVDSFYL